MSYQGIILSSSLQCSSSVQDSSSGLTAYDLQLRKVITPSSELRFWCSWTLWKSYRVKNPYIDILMNLELILVPEIRKTVGTAGNHSIHIINSQIAHKHTW